MLIGARCMTIVVTLQRVIACTVFDVTTKDRSLLDWNVCVWLYRLERESVF